VQNLYKLFLELPQAMTGVEFNAVPLSSTRKDFLARGDDGSPIFLLHDSSEAKYNPDINFRHLSAQFHVTCNVKTGDVDFRGQFCLVKCDPTIPELHEMFVRCVSAAIESLPEFCGTSELESCIFQLLDLFRALSMSNGRQVSGLWAELFVIAMSGNIKQALTLWHEDKFDRFDFSSNKTYLEVKSSVRNIRAHEFTLEQLHAPSQGNGFVVSILLQPLSGGVSVMQLAREIETMLSGTPSLKQKLWKGIAMALGSDFSDKLDRHFDLPFAKRSLIIYSMHDIPKPDTPIDSRVTSLRFTSDITDVSSTILESSYTGLHRIFR